MPGTLRTPPAQPRVPDQSGDLHRSPPGTLRLSPPSPLLRSFAGTTRDGPTKRSDTFSTRPNADPPCSSYPTARQTTASTHRFAHCAFHPSLFAEYPSARPQNTLLRLPECVTHPATLGHRQNTTNNRFIPAPNKIWPCSVDQVTATFEIGFDSVRLALRASRRADLVETLLHLFGEMSPLAPASDVVLPRRSAQLPEQAPHRGPQQVDIGRVVHVSLDHKRITLVTVIDCAAAGAASLHISVTSARLPSAARGSARVQWNRCPSARAGAGEGLEAAASRRPGPPGYLLLMSGCRDVGMSGCRDVGMSGCRDVGMSGCRDVGMSGCRDVGMSGCPPSA